MVVAVRRLAAVLAAAVATLVAVVAMALPASAHVLPTSTIQLAVTASNVVATVDIPLSDLEAATGLDLGDETQADIDSQADALKDYLLTHFAPTSDDGDAWTVTEGTLTVDSAGDAATTGIYDQVETTFTLTPPAGSDIAEEESSFDLGYDAVVEKVATHTVIVTVASDTTDKSFSGAYEVGTVQRDTVTNKVEELHVELGSGSSPSALGDMVKLGMQHIKEGTDHQLFLLTLLLPAPLLAAGRRWGRAVGGRRAVRRITAVTLAFTLGHSLTLALGALGVPVPQQLVEAAIAASILVAAVHAIRPLFPGREALVAAAFGLVHGLAFSEALRALHLTGTHLVLALLGFNLGIEAMQLIVVVLVLPPLVLIARSDHYGRLRVAAAAVTGLAAVGWLTARLGLANPVADLADQLGTMAAPVVMTLWVVALLLTVTRRAPAPARA
ncbi:HupE/UreJ family protein [Nocardioides sp. Kera G14]|uniref:HupE/UreJ family protein n=1 Tax=Nocardioides sp. Kera G14 TaxID=2884264 RepID=UPI001D10DC77|nr:HupE/UreJ family protein [Nocardioides sp. Kera G14]UDY22954.1 HupE/UreJ family protein [Nocardioides sp. Kera G14]